MSINHTDLREGDRVRITLEAEFTQKDSDGDFHFQFSAARHTWFPAEVISRAEITRLSPPIRAGDRVRLGGGFGTVKAVDGDEAWVLGDDYTCHDTVDLSSLTRISEESK